MNGELATKRDLTEAVGELRGEMVAMKGELRGEMVAMKGELRGEMVAMKDELRGEMVAMKDELQGQMAAMGTELQGQMAAMETRLQGQMTAMKTELQGQMTAMKTEFLREIGVGTSHVANVMIEEVRRLVTVVEEKYQDLPAAHARLRGDLDAHAADLQLHRRAPAPLPRRTRRSQAR